jgi:hypothetical protein
LRVEAVYVKVQDAAAGVDRRRLHWGGGAQGVRREECRYRAGGAAAPPGAQRAPPAAAGCDLLCHGFHARWDSAKHGSRQGKSGDSQWRLTTRSEPLYVNKRDLLITLGSTLQAASVVQPATATPARCACWGAGGHCARGARRRAAKRTPPPFAARPILNTDMLPSSCLQGEVRAGRAKLCAQARGSRAWLQHGGSGCLAF